MDHGTGSRPLTMLIYAGWILWVVSALLVILQIILVTLSTSRKSTVTELFVRFLEEGLEDGADEDDPFVHIDPIRLNDDDGKDWFALDHWVQPSTLSYDLIQGFLYVANAFFLAWIFWGCLVHCGVFPDERVYRNRWARRVKDGRGVLAPLRDFDALNSDTDDDDDDDKSRDSMEYGDAHNDDDVYGDVDVKKLDKEIAKAAEEFFRKSENRKKKLKERRDMKANAPGPEENLFMDMDMPPPKPENRFHAEVILL